MTHIYTDGACLLNYSGGLAIGLCGFYDETQCEFDANYSIHYGAASDSYGSGVYQI
jgi:hypothetical protein